MSIEPQFNEKFVKAFEILSSNEYLNERLKAMKENFYVFADISVKQSKINNDQNIDDFNLTLDDVRQLMIIHFLGKLLDKKLTVYTNEKYQKTLSQCLSLFEFNDFIDLKSIELNEDLILCEFEHTKYNDVSNNGLVNLRQLIDDRNLKNYDKNIRFCNIENEKNLYHYIGCLQNSLTSNHLTLPNSNILEISAHSCFVRLQKANLLTKIISKNNFNIQEKYLIVLPVKSKINKFEDAFKEKQRYFETAGEQREVLSKEQQHSNIQLLSKASITFDLLKISHTNEIKYQNVENSYANEQDTTLLLYNCARLLAVIDKFESYVQKGLYENLPSIDTIDFENLFKSEIERKLCNEYLFKHDKCLNDILNGLLAIKESDSFEIKLKIHNICRFLFDASKLFSIFYNKIKILEDVQLKHLHNSMHARIYLAKAILNLFKYYLNLFNLKPSNRI